MLFGRFSRNPKPFKETLQEMIDEDHLSPPPWELTEQSERVKKFHERITIGYGHKSVADHAMVHFCLEGVSAVAERDFTSARLIAASSKSTRYVDFRDAGFVHPQEWPDDAYVEYNGHCLALLGAYESLIGPATEVIRQIVPYDDKAKEVWKKQKGWENATHKRALDMVRDLLPMSIRTSFGITMSATGLREMTDKRMTNDPYNTLEVMKIASHTRAAAKAAVPVLLPDGFRPIPRQPFVPGVWKMVNRIHAPMSVRLIDKTNWHTVQIALGMSAPELVKRWIEERHHKMVPDRSAEMMDLTFKIEMPIAIHRDLGRHRMMTQLRGSVSPALGYGADPLLSNNAMWAKFPGLALIAKAHAEALLKADERLTAWSSVITPQALQYACPLATMIPVVWKVNVRELVHLLGLRTVPQGHPSYRTLVQMVAKSVRHSDPLLKGLVDAVTNFDDVIIGRPG